VLEELHLMAHQQSLWLASALGDANSNSLQANQADSALLAHLGYAPVSLDAIQARCGLDTATLQAQLLTLELDGAVGRLPGGLFQRLATA